MLSENEVIVRVGNMLQYSGLRQQKFHEKEFAARS